MNKKVFLFCFFFCIICVESFCVANPNDIASKRKSSRIRLERLSEKGLIQSVFIPYIVEVDGQTIEITHLRSLFNITLDIFNESGVYIYHCSIDPVSGNHQHIDISDWDEGYYTICFKDSNGNIIYGELEL